MQAQVKTRWGNFNRGGWGAGEISLYPDPPAEVKVDHGLIEIVQADEFGGDKKVRLSFLPQHADRLCEKIREKAALIMGDVLE